MTNSTGTKAALETVRASIRQLDVIHERDGVKVTHIGLEPGEEVPWHRHSQVTDTFYAVNGPLTIETKAPDGAVQLSAGDVFQTAIDQPHRVSNGTNKTVRFLLVQGGGAFDFLPVEP